MIQSLRLPLIIAVCSAGFLALALVFSGMRAASGATHAQHVFDPVFGPFDYTVLSSGHYSDFWTSCSVAVIEFEQMAPNLEPPPQSIGPDLPWGHDFGGEWRPTPVDGGVLPLHFCQREFDAVEDAVFERITRAASANAGWYVLERLDTFLLWSPEEGIAARIYFGD